jgi:hypothetical protein
MGIVGIVLVLLLLVLLAWLMMPAAGKRGVPRKSRWWPQSRLEAPLTCVCSAGISEASQARSILPLGERLVFPFHRESGVSLL